MFIYAIATAYTLHCAYLFTKSLTKTFQQLARHTHRLGTALELANTIARIPITQDRNTQTPPVDNIPHYPVANDHHDEYISVEEEEEEDDVNNAADGDTDYTLGEYEEDVIEEIMEEEDAFVSSEKPDNAYFLGHYFVSPDAQDAEYPLMMLVAIQPATYLTYSHYYVEKYMAHYLDNSRKMEIMKTAVRRDGQFRIVNVVLKTHWIALIQRHWKNVYSQRKYIIHKRMSPANQFKYLFTGNISPDAESLPSLKGMLSHYATIRR